MPSMNLDARLNASDSARAVNVSRQTFNYWRRTGRVAPGADGRYRLGDVIDVERAMRNSGQSSRNMWRGVQRPTFA